MGIGNFHIDSTNGLLAEARQLSSPNCDHRPGGAADIDLLVVHGISLPPGEYGGAHVDALFTNTLDPDTHPYFKQIEHLRVSSHLLIARDGQVTQYVPFTHRAWHAGESCFEGRVRCNDYSIGIELEGEDDVAYEYVQYQTLAGIVNELMRCYPLITRQRVTGHSDIAPQRKTDPGPAFEWQTLFTLQAAKQDGSDIVNG